MKLNAKQLILPLAVILVALLVLLVILAGCEEKEPATEPPVTTTEPVATTTNPPETTQPTQPSETVPPTTEPTVPPTTEPPVVYYNPLTGEVVDAVSEYRPYAVVLNNVKPAMPLCGAGSADILYEMRVEGGATRCLGIYTDIEAVQRVGSIRSARTYSISVAQSYDAIFVHIGGSESAYEIFKSTGWDEIDGNRGPVTKYFKSDQNRRDDGYAKEHTFFITGEEAVIAATEKGCTLTREGGVSYGLLFAEDATPDGETANTVEVKFYKNGKSTTFTYNAERGLYEGSQYGTEFIDGDTGEVLSFENVISIKVETGYEVEKTNVHTMELTGSGDGYFACGGKIIPIKWNRASTSDPFSYTLEDGTPLVLGVGKTYVGIVPLGYEVVYS